MILKIFVIIEKMIKKKRRRRRRRKIGVDSGCNKLCKL
jgi:hypothetical protein